jgi:copper chaperone
MLEFDIQAMSCGHCAGVVTRAVQQVDPAATVVVDLAAHKVSVETSESREAVAAALTEAGYPPD